MNTTVRFNALRVFAYAFGILVFSSFGEQLFKFCSLTNSPQEDGRDYFAEFVKVGRLKWAEQGKNSYSFRCNLERRFKGASVRDESFQVEAKRLGEQRLIKLLNRNETNASRVLGFNSDYYFELGSLESNQWFPKVVNGLGENSDIIRKFSDLVIQPDSPHIILMPGNLSLKDIPWEDSARVKLINAKSIEISNSQKLIEFEFNFSFDSSVKTLSGGSAEAYKTAVIRFDPSEWIPVFSRVEYDSGDEKIRCVSNIEYSNEGVMSDRNDHLQFAGTQLETNVAMNGFEWLSRPKSEEFRMPYFGLPEFSTSKTSWKWIVLLVVVAFTAVFVVAKKIAIC